MDNFSQIKKKKNPHNKVLQTVYTSVFLQTV